MNVILKYPTKLFYKVVKNGLNLTHYEYVNESLFLGKYKIEELKINEESWIIHSDTSSINGLNCQKATINFGGRKWIAWFSVDIPISDGPYKFSGLPGLIVNIEDSTKSWKFQLIEISTNVQRKALIDKFQFFKKRSIRKLDFLKMKRYSLDNQYELELANGNLKGVDNETLEMLKKMHYNNAKENNNWIELYP